MDITNFFFKTNLYCTFHGIASNLSRNNKFFLYIKLIFLFLNVLLTTFAIFRSVYRLSTGHLSLTDVIRIVLSFMTFKLLHTLERKVSWVDEAVNFMLKSLTKKQLNQIRRLDCLACLTFSTLESIAGGSMMFLYLTNQFDAARTFIAGPREDISDTICFILMMQFNFSVGYIVMAPFMYSQIQLLASLYCENINDSLIFSEEIVLEKLIFRCRFINRLRHSINNSVSSIPFALILCVWIFFVYGLSFVYTFDSIKSNRLMLVVIAMLIATVLIILEMLIRLVTRFERKASEFRESCASLTSRSKLCNDHDQYQMANLLNNFLTTEKMPPMMAAGMVEIRPNFTVSLLNSMISFTVMVLTSFRVYLK